MRRIIIIAIALVLCVLWFLAITPDEVGDSVRGDFHYSLPVTTPLIVIWLLGWIPIWCIAYFLIRKKKK
jgi:O-antigen/teichoic acid export membrane protein